ncbi:MAG: LPP20 family lipoprotein [Sulfurimonas sp.]|nr:LPP20 family lipoprotein [Sulfurimonas sp.]
MKYSLLLVALLSASSIMAETTQVVEPVASETKVTVVCPPDQTIEINELEGKIKILETQLGDVVQKAQKQERVLGKNQSILISVIGQGVAPMNTLSPAQAYALAKRAAVADAYRLVAEKVKGVRVDGQDVIKNMMVKRSTVRTSVNAMIRNANVVETTFKEGLCEVEMEITIAHSQFAQ